MVISPCISDTEVMRLAWIESRVSFMAFMSWVTLSRGDTTPATMARCPIRSKAQAESLMLTLCVTLTGCAGNNA